MRGGKQPRLTSAARPQHARMLMFKDHSPVALLQVRRRHSLSSMVMWLAVMILIAAQPAVAGWGPRSFLTGFAVYSGPISGSVKSLMIQNHSTIASAATRSAPSAAAGSELHPLDQCGGEGGLCSATSIGIPCGDHQWGGAYCSENFNCSRSNSSWWSCELVPGREPNSAEQEYIDALKAAKAKTKTSKRTPTTRRSRGSSRYRGNAEAADREAYRQPETQQGPIVPVCGPAQLAAGGTAMCNGSTNGVFGVFPASLPDASSGAGSAGSSCSLVAVLLRCAAALLAATVVQQLLGS